ncbi:MAG: MBL fold metallo-hydrolase [bacterium]|nr:MBL fold metallo-hydrolase [bacterium]
MKVKVLASGSKGNCSFIECNKTKILIDAGISYYQIKKTLDDINISIKELDIILITHSHSDHIKGLSTLINKTNITLYCPLDVYEDIKKKVNIKKYHIIDRELIINDIEIKTTRLSHDVNCYSYIINHDNNTLVYITDTGYLNRKYFETIKNKEIYIIESNHDENILMNGSYPYILKQRILSDKGHLSNHATANILKKIVGKNTRYIFLAHLSEHNNDKEICRRESVNALKKTEFNINNLIVTDQYISTDLVEV